MTTFQDIEEGPCRVVAFEGREPSSEDGVYVAWGAAAVQVDGGPVRNSFTNATCSPEEYAAFCAQGALTPLPFPLPVPHGPVVVLALHPYAPWRPHLMERLGVGETSKALGHVLGQAYFAAYSPETFDRVRRDAADWLVATATSPRVVVRHALLHMALTLDAHVLARRGW